MNSPFALNPNSYVRNKFTPMKRWTLQACPLLPLLILLVGLPSEKIIAAPRKHALVIGNGAYNQQTPLPNPPNDATEMAKLLRTAGFEVSAHTNLRLREFRTAVRAFAEGLAPGDVALVFYAGHGVQYEGENYFIPCDAVIREAYEIADEAVSLSSVIRAVEAHQCSLKLIFLDCCRNFPESWKLSRSLSRGLAAIQPPRSTLIGYATAPNTTASDGSGKNSPYTEAF
jgi:uncharacterized caspase-like protein